MPVAHLGSVRSGDWLEIRFRFIFTFGIITLNRDRNLVLGFSRSTSCLYVGHGVGQAGYNRVGKDLVQSLRCFLSIAGELPQADDDFGIGILQVSPFANGPRAQERKWREGG